ncbi:hypothetical protein QQ045_023388 [Rhodiola kirilowii]
MEATKEVRQYSQRWRKRAILHIYLVRICLKPKQKPINSSMNLKELSKLEKSQCCSPST